MIELFGHAQQDSRLGIDPIGLFVEMSAEVQTFQTAFEMLKPGHAVFSESGVVVGILELLDQLVCAKFAETFLGAVLAEAAAFKIDDLLKNSPIASFACLLKQTFRVVRHQHS